MPQRIRLVSGLASRCCVCCLLFLAQLNIAAGATDSSPTQSLDAEMKLRLHKKLDRLASQGHGLVQNKFAPEVSQPEKNYKHVSTMSIYQKQGFDAKEYERQHQGFQQEIEERNAESVKKFSELVASIKKACGGKMYPSAIVGMSDETFRNCTNQARFNPLLQIVVSNEGDIPLRLYIFSGNDGSRIYAINGVITAVKDLAN